MEKKEQVQNKLASFALVCSMGGSINTKALAEQIDALYSDPPSPEMVCPESNLRILKLQKSTGCFLETVVFSNGKVCACWQTTVPEVAIYENIEQFLSVRTSERGYKILSDSQEK
jgi:hypothetical protein